MDSILKILKMVLALTTGLMGVSTQVSGKMGNNMERERSLPLQVLKERAIGRMELELVGKIMNDFLFM